MTVQIDECAPEPLFSAMDVIVLTMAALMLATVLLPNFVRTRDAGSMQACKSNLKNMGTAMEMYSTDWEGSYPPFSGAETKRFLAPNYLKTIPDCPAAGTDSYTMERGPKATYNTKNYSEYYFIKCSGYNHSRDGVPPDYPQYNGIVGLMER